MNWVQPGYARSGPASERATFDHSTTKLLVSLHARLADIRDAADPEAFAVAVECEIVLEEIRKELAAIAATRR